MSKKADRMSNKDIQRKNVQLVLSMLKKNEANTVTKLTDEIARFTSLDTKIVKGHVKEILNSGVDLGFIYKRGERYAADPIGCNSEDEEEDDYDIGEPQDSRRRTRSRRRSRSRSRSRRRSSRRRSRRRR